MIPTGSFRWKQDLDRIRAVYRDRDIDDLRYDRFKADVKLQRYSLGRAIASLLDVDHARDLSTVSVLDVGCGTGSLLRRFVDWGAEPSRLTGLDPLIDRVAEARSRSAPGIRWICGSL
ncbi:MAG: methyltransferase domain-containing protein, partial [Gemmatimonadales bacterium]